MEQNVYAHSLAGKPPAEWQTLQAHAEGVAAKGAAFAERFGSGEWARLLGRLHDLGKARASFQSYLARCNGLADPCYDDGEHNHSGAGAAWAAKHLFAGTQAKLGYILAYCVAGHHAGLPDWIGGEKPNGALCQRLADEAGVLDEPAVRDWVAAHEAEWPASGLKAPWRFNEKDLAFWIRMLYSCLVDADFLDTEAFMDAGRGEARGNYPPLAELAEKFFAMLDAMQKTAADSEVNRVRAEIRAACEKAAADAPGLFLLTVPTGGGKTLSGTAFALRHALKHGKKRVIYVIPYTSIIEQTADVLRKFLGDANVVEHHSNLDPEHETQASRLAAENWDAPIIVTTSVQFFESLYACKSSRCRKLHNIVDSVVILDEAQLLPPRLLIPCLDAIAQLVRRYRVSVVLSTATQPALERQPSLIDVPAKEIVPPALDLYKRLRRTHIELPPDLRARESWEEIAAKLCGHERVLCVVNTRRDCRELHALMPEGTIHLSASQCGEHRSRLIAEIKERLAADEPIRVVSTQLVEAGVDIDFPVVYRAFTGLASIAQSAGRCNREGRLPELGRVVVFMPPKASPPGDLRKAEDAFLNLLAGDKSLDVNAPESFSRFFEHWYASSNEMDANRRKFYGWLVEGAYYFQFQFREAAAGFQMIEDASVPIIVRYGEADQWIERLRVAGPKREIMRRLQRFTVTVHRDQIADLQTKGLVEEVQFAKQGSASGIFVQTVPGAYTEEFGFDLSGVGLSPEDLVI